ncbi:MAG: aminotransferase class I/II-fold pyridoxal phosphate-dependent enzyme [Verrucomicrobiota bacterium]|nr:aminotransferase class I/II-fold pyridoxal phosphate-dependent enzyme [Verrucomicrobiota bacterium]
MNEHPLVSPDNTLRECMEVIDVHAKKISFVSENGILVGVVTDGDLRRALLNKSILDDSVRSVMNTNFISFPIGTDSKIIREKFSKRISHIPLVDDKGSLVDVADPNGNFRISVLKPSLKGNELNYVTDCIESTWISSQGKYVTKFEKAFEEAHPGMHAIAVSNGTVALHLGLIALGVKSKDEVIVPNLTFAASANAVINAGAKPVFCEIDRKTWCIQPEELRRLVGPKTKAIMPVHLYGQPCDMDSLKEICAECDLLMIEDSAEALGSEWKAQKVGTFGDAATFSFFGNKTISTGEGGMILFSDPEVAEKARILRDHGMSKNKRYWHDVVGYNYRLTNMQAAIGVAQMEKFQEILSKKLKIAAFYESALKGIPGITNLPATVKETLHSNWLFGVILDEKINVENVISELLSRGIETRPFFHTLNSMPPYMDYRTSISLDNSETISQRGLSLPSSVDLREEELQTISQNLIHIIRENIEKA